MGTRVGGCVLADPPGGTHGVGNSFSCVIHRIFSNPIFFYSLRTVFLGVGGSARTPLPLGLRFFFSLSLVGPTKVGGCFLANLPPPE